MFPDVKKIVAVLVTAIWPGLLAAGQISVMLDAHPDMSFDKGFAYQKDAMLWGEAGDPAIPVQHIRLLLPPDVGPETVSMTLDNLQYVTQASARIAPVPPVHIWTSTGIEALWPPGRLFENGKNTLCYKNDAFFPADHLIDSRLGEIRGWKILTVTIALLQYNPVQHKVRFLKDGILNVDYTRTRTGGAAIQESGTISSTGEKWVRPLVENYNDMVGEYLGGHARTSGTGLARGYALVTTNHIAAASKVIRDFLRSKIQRGFTCYLVTENDWGGGTGDIAADNIRRWLKKNYLKLNIEYVLLLGNPHPDNGNVPMKKFKSDDTNGGRGIPSDLYYSDLTGNWDLDKDGVFGESDDDMGPGGIDMNTDVYVGRIPYYDDIQTVDVILEKCIAYENAGDPVWRRYTLLPMDSLDDMTPGYDLGEAIKDSILAPAALECYRIYPENASTELPAETTPCTYNNVYSVWRSTTFGLVVWSTHGQTDFARNVMTTAHAAGLPAEHPAICFQNSCYNASPYTKDNLAHAVLKTGAVSTVAATDIVTYMPGPFHPGFTNSRSMAYEFVRRVLRERKSTARALDDIRRKMNYRYRFRDILSHVVYGDPSLGLYTCKAPSKIAVYKDRFRIHHQDEIDLGPVETGTVKKTAFRFYNNNTEAIVLNGRPPVNVSGNARLEYDAIDKIPAGAYLEFHVIFDVRYPRDYRIRVSLAEEVRIFPPLTFSVLARGKAVTVPEQTQKFWGVFANGGEKGFHFWTGSIQVGTSVPWLSPLKETIDDSAISSCWVRAGEYRMENNTGASPRTGDIILEITDSGNKRRFEKITVAQAPFSPVPVSGSGQKSFKSWPEFIAQRCSKIEIQRAAKPGEELTHYSMIEVLNEQQVFKDFCKIMAGCDSSWTLAVVEHEKDGSVREYSPFRIDRPGTGQNQGKWLLVRPSYPNPFNASTRIPFVLHKPAHVTIDIYNLRGQCVRRLEDGRRDAGYHEAAWDGTDDSGKILSSGAFFCVVNSHGIRHVKKIMFMK